MLPIPFCIHSIYMEVRSDFKFQRIMMMYVGFKDAYNIRDIPPNPFLCHNWRLCMNIICTQFDQIGVYGELSSSTNKVHVMDWIPHTE